MERHYCYSCRDSHAFLDAAEWAQVEPLWRTAQLALAHARRIARRQHLPVPEAEVKRLYQPALAKHTEITGDPISNPYNLFHRQLVHECKWRPRADDPPPSSSPQIDSGAA